MNASGDILSQQIVTLGQFQNLFSNVGKALAKNAEIIYETLKLKF